jgi:hypothetical protein
MTKLLKNPQPPPFYDLLMSTKRMTMLGLRVCLPGKISAVDLPNGQVNVLITLKQKTSTGAVVDYPELIGRPVFSLQGGGVGALFPIAVDDQCMVIFGDRSLDQWIEGGAPQIPPNGRLHDLSDGIVLVGLNSLQNKILSPLLANEGGLCETKNSTGAKVAIDVSTGLVTVKNSNADLTVIITGLTTAINDLITALNLLATTGGPTTQTISAATVASFVPITNSLISIQTDITELLK